MAKTKTEKESLEASAESITPVTDKGKWAHEELQDVESRRLDLIKEAEELKTRMQSDLNRTQELSIELAKLNIEKDIRTRDLKKAEGK